MAIITLTTDFGIDDSYVAEMKGVIPSINPEVTIVDICHTINPQNIAQAAYILSTTNRRFPRGTIHIVVVDPGVGTERQAVLLINEHGYFLGPDNGVLSCVVEEAGEGIEAFAITNPSFWLSPLSDTFHGRDIFAPVAAHLSLGAPPHEIGDLIPSLTTFVLPRPQIGEDRMLIGKVVHIDHFGNLITDIRRSDLPKGRLFIEVCGHIIDNLSTSYEEGEEFMAIIGSSEQLEVSVQKGSAARYLGARIGDEVKVGVTRTSPKGGFR